MTIREPLDVVEAIERGDEVPEHYFAKSDPAGPYMLGILAVIVAIVLTAIVVYCGCSK